MTLRRARPAALVRLVRTRFEDLQATDDLLTGIGKALQDTAREYRLSDDGIAGDPGRVGDELGGGVR